MKFLKNFWDKVSINSEDEALLYFKSTVLKTNKNKDYYNSWSAIEKKVKSIREDILDALNKTLILLDKEEFKKL